MGCGRTARVCVGRLSRRSSRLPTKPRELTSSRHRPPTTTPTTTWRTASEVHTQRCPGSCYPPLLAGGLGGARTEHLGSGLGASRTGHCAQRDVVVVIRTPFRLRHRPRYGHRHRLRLRPGIRAAASLPNAEYGHSSLLRGPRWDRAGWLGRGVGCLLRRAFALKRRMAFASCLLRGGHRQAILGLTTSARASADEGRGYLLVWLWSSHSRLDTPGVMAQAGALVRSNRSHTFFCT